MKVDVNKDLFMERKHNLDKFYDILKILEDKIGGNRYLRDCNGRQKWPQQGVYFFFEHGEYRQNGEPRVVRVGTHAVSIGSMTTLWERLRTHKGTKKLTGNHRRSVFRDLIGLAFINKENLNIPSWCKDKNEITQNEKNDEVNLEKEVSIYLGDMPFLHLTAIDEAGPNSIRSFIEINSIALLSNYNRPKIDAPSKNWMGNLCGDDKVINSGLWNRDYVDLVETEPQFISTLSCFVNKM